jgi:hypothetical protein
MEPWLQQALTASKPIWELPLCLWRETEEAAIRTPGDWVFDHVPAPALYRKQACCVSVPVKLSLEYMRAADCDCAATLRPLFEAAGDAWMFPSPEVLASLIDLQRRACSLHTYVGSLLRRLIPFAQGDARADPLVLQSSLPKSLLGPTGTEEMLYKVDDLAMQTRRDVVGNPFRPVEVTPELLAWRDGTTPRLARGIYAQRAFGDMPILADALEEAGAPEALVAHCREPGPHVRGCCALDLLAPELSAPIEEHYRVQV